MNDNTQNSLKFLIKLGNCFGILPINGLSSSHPQDLFFSWTSWKNLYTYLLILVMVFNAILCFIHWSLTKFNFERLAVQLFHLNAITLLLFYLYLAKKWQKFMKQWDEIDEMMNPVYGYLKDFERKAKLIMIFLMPSSVILFLFWILYRFVEFEMKKFKHPTAEEYFHFTFPEYFDILEYNEFWAIIATISALLSRIIWAYNDMFIISISLALTLRFKQITNRLIIHGNQKKEIKFWEEVRNDYNRLANISYKCDKRLSYMVLVSFFSNIIFLLILLSNTSGNMQYDVEIIYHLLAFTLLIGRLIAVSLYAAEVNNESKEPAGTLNFLPSSSFNVEVERLLTQISYNNIGVTGSNMFLVTRGLILSVAGAIVTYELVVIQFSRSFAHE